ncbi:MAG: DUF1592 domain-containing protein [Verrucomicrobiales bacterium]|nr:DUF1592 domain-containing protein [Verrucomicrobiales bacterium]
MLSIATKRIWLPVVLLLSTGAHAIDLENHPGKAIYRNLCAECHADDGQGVEDLADDPLVGSRTLESLAGRIERTMPEDEEDLCVGEDARIVAEYIYHAFYSEEARARNTPARIDITRLTEPQYRNSIADLVQTFRATLNYPEDRGLKATYFGGYKFNDRKEQKDQNKKDRYDRNDPFVKVDFGTGIPSHPEAKEFNSEQFSVRWEGTILPEETGVYEFVVRTRNGATLWVNEKRSDDLSDKTIDGWVAPNNEVRDETGKIFLIGGRPYPIRLEFFTYKEEKASVELLWKPPHGILHTIPKSHLSPTWSHESLIVDVPFPADDRSVGYERGTMVSRAWYDAVTAGAVQSADYIVSHIDELARIQRDDPKRAEKIRTFSSQFVDRAFRRPLTPEEKAIFVAPHFEGTETADQGLRRLVLFSLTAPRFLYPNWRQNETPDEWDVAANLALSLWDSLPDHQLLGQAAKGQTANPKIAGNIANRMVWDWRTKAKIRGFFHHWLELERSVDLSKDETVYPEFDDAVLADLKTSLFLTTDEAVWGRDSSYRDLMLANYLFLNERLSKLYGSKQVKGGFQKVTLDPKVRAGVVTHPLLLSSLAYHNNTSPIHRGVFLTRNIVGMTLKSPPMANEFKEGKFNPNFTMRQKVTEMTRDKACMSCHVTINPLGFSLEHYDGMGRWRTRDQNKPVNSVSNFKTEEGETIKLTGARDVAEFAADTPSAHRTFIEQLFHHLAKQPMLAYGPDTMDTLYADFQNSGFKIPELIKQIAITSSLNPNQSSPSKQQVASTEP